MNVIFIGEFFFQTKKISPYKNDVWISNYLTIHKSLWVNFVSFGIWRCRMPRGGKLCFKQMIQLSGNCFQVFLMTLGKIIILDWTNLLFTSFLEKTGANKVFEFLFFLFSRLQTRMMSILLMTTWIPRIMNKPHILSV